MKTKENIEISAKDDQGRRLRYIWFGKDDKMIFLMDKTKDLKALWGMIGAELRARSKGCR